MGEWDPATDYLLEHWLSAFDMDNSVCPGPFSDFDMHMAVALSALSFRFLAGGTCVGQGMFHLEGKNI